MENAKVTITEKELKIMGDREFFVQKKIITETVSNIFAKLRDGLKSEVQKSGFIFPEGTDTDTGKLSKGENYREFPYIILDYPKKFSRENIFSFRTMFWWGNQFSFHFLLSGESFDGYHPKILERIHLLRGKDFLFCIHSTPWEYHFGDNNVIPLENAISDPKLFEGMTFFKISKKSELKDWDKLVQEGTETIANCLNLIK